MALASAYCYRVGGMSYEEAQKYSWTKWLPKWCVKSWFRDYLCMLITLTWCFIHLTPVAWWRYLIMAILFKLAISTYWDDSKLNWMKGKDNFYMHGFGIGLSLLPIALSWWTPLYAIILGGSMGLICDITSDVNVEELSRGSLIILAIPLLLLML